MNRIFFIDVDGTLVTQKGIVLESVCNVIRAVSNMWIRCFYLQDVQKVK